MVISIPKNDIESLIREIYTLEGREITDQICDEVHRVISGSKSGVEVFKELNTLQRFRSEGPKIYRDTVNMHQRRIHNITMFLRFLYYFKFGFSSNNNSGGIDFKKQRNGALHHDIFEGCTPLGDIPTHIKDGLTQKARDTLESLEKHYFQTLAEQLTLSGYHYTGKRGWNSLRDEFTKKESLEAKLNSYKDKIDGWGMSFLEVIMGNRGFIKPLGRYEEIILGEKFSPMKELASSIYGEVYEGLGDFSNLCSTILHNGDEKFALSEKESQFLADFGNSGFGVDSFISSRILPSIDIFNFKKTTNISQLLGIAKGQTIPDMVFSKDERIPAIFKAWLLSQYPEYNYGSNGLEILLDESHAAGRNAQWSRYTQPLYHLLTPEKPEIIH